ncbi:SAV_2336 N-terminal domain-related protein [Dactylosporangium sp. NPDC050688]|uniref:SAV_2336 N-terminal domain-related protein n=1 Tax=Dactylosporangium sp. NPDC050688 TaxID=3157217 RepID=UPI0033EADAF3
MIDRVVRAVAAAVPGCSAEAVADALWLATIASRQDRPAPEPAVAATGEPAGRDGTADPPAEPAPRPEQPAPAGGVTGGELVEATPAGAAVAGVPAVAVGLGTAAARRRPVPAGHALAPFRRIRRPGPPVVDVDATVEATADAGRLTVVTRPGWDRGLDVAIVVDDSPVAAAWADALGDFESLLRRTGAFRQVTRWTLRWQAGGSVLLRDGTGAAHGPLRLTDPTGRRLVLVATDATTDPWYAPPIWTLLHRWARLMPVAVLHLLPEQYRGFTALGSPTVALRARRPGAVNTAADVVRAWWDSDDEPGAVALPVVTLRPHDVRRWAHAVASGAGWVDAVWARTPDARPAGATNAGLSPADRVRAFQARATPDAQTLARILAAAPVLSLPLLQVLQRELLPAAGPAELAEVLVSGLLERLPAAPTGPRSQLRWRPGTAELLARGTSTSQDWSVYEVLSEHLQRWGGTGQSIEALLAHPLGTGTVDPSMEPFALMGRHLAQRLGIELPDPSPDRPVGTTRRPASVLCVEGMVASLRSTAQVAATWHAAIADGLLRAAGDPQQVTVRVTETVEVLRLADLFDGEPATVSPAQQADQTDFERAVLLGWLHAVGSGDTATGAGAWSRVRATVLRVLSRTALGQVIVDSAGAAVVERVSRYFTDQRLRAAVQRRIAAAITDDTQVIVAHSFGAIAVYETLCAYPALKVRALITLGTPLGSPAVLRRLRPPPGQSLRNVGSWTNVAARGDVVAMPSALPVEFGGWITNVAVDNGIEWHSVARYLSQPQTGAAILAGLGAGLEGDLRRHAADCVVIVDGAAIGTGFFIAPGVLLTARHLVDGQDTVRVRWRDEWRTATVRWTPDTTTTDLAVLYVQPAPAGHPALRLADRQPVLGERYLGLGYTGQGGAHEVMSIDLVFSGRAERTLGFDGEARGGMSGAPVIDLETGAVLGVVHSTHKQQRTTHAEPVGSLRDMPAPDYQRLLRAHDLHHRPGPAVRGEQRPRRGGFLADVEERELLALLAGCRVAAPSEHRRAFRTVAGGARDPELPLNDYRDVVAELTELIPPTTGLPHVLDYVAGLVPTAEPLRDWVVRAAAARGVDSLLRLPPPTRPSLIIRMVPSAEQPGRFRYTVWNYQDASNVSVAAETERPVDLTEARDFVRRAVADAVNRFAGEVRLEFVAPYRLLEIDFEDWHTDERPWSTLGMEYPVVVRSLDRSDDTDPGLARVWLERWRAIGDAAAAPLRRMPCRLGDLDLQVFRAELRLLEPYVPVFPTSPVNTAALGAMLDQGVPVMLWRRGSCPGTPDGAHEDCPGQRFAAALCHDLDGVHRDDLPDQVRRLRNQAAAEPEHQRTDRDLVLLWDDPDRQPERPTLTPPL